MQVNSTHHGTDHTASLASTKIYVWKLQLCHSAPIKHVCQPVTVMAVTLICTN